MILKDEFIEAMKTQKPGEWASFTGYPREGQMCAIWYVGSTLPGMSAKFYGGKVCERFGFTYGQVLEMYDLNDASSSMEEAQRKIESYVRGL